MGLVILVPRVALVMVMVVEMLLVVTVVIMLVGWRWRWRWWPWWQWWWWWCWWWSWGCVSEKWPCLWWGTEVVVAAVRGGGGDAGSGNWEGEHWLVIMVVVGRGYCGWIRKVNNLEMTSVYTLYQNSFIGMPLTCHNIHCFKGTIQWALVCLQRCVAIARIQF